MAMTMTAAGPRQTVLVEAEADADAGERGMAKEGEGGRRGGGKGKEKEIGKCVSKLIECSWRLGPPDGMDLERGVRAVATLG